MKLVRLIPIALLILSCESQKKNLPSALVGEWIGQFSVFAKNIPYPYILNINEDGTCYRTALFNDQIDTLRWSYKSVDTLQIGNDLFSIGDFNGTDLSLIGKRMSRKFSKMEDVSLPLGISDLKQKIQNSRWNLAIKETQNESFRVNEVYQFKDNKAEVYRSYVYRDRELYNELEVECFRITERNGKFFLVRLGNKDVCENSYIRFEQILSIDDNELTTLRLDNLEKQQIIYKAFNEQINTESFTEFLVCEKQWVEPYFRMGTTYAGGIDAFNEFVRANYSPCKECPDNNGIVRIAFVVNCHGDIGGFSLQQSDLQFKPKQLDGQIIAQLLDVVIRSAKWIPGKLEDRVFDTRKHISFRIVSGQISEIFP